MYKFCRFSQSKRSVFLDSALVLVLRRKSSARLQRFASEHLQTLILQKNSKAGFLKNFAQVLIKVLLGESIKFVEFKSLTKNEKSLLELIAKKKRLLDWKQTLLSLDIVNRLGRKPAPRKAEENIKFAMKKAFRFLQCYFRICFLPEVAPQLKSKFKALSPSLNFEYAFFGFYFDDVAARVNQALEKFFAPSSSSRVAFAKAGLVSKTMSRLYLSYLRLGKAFITDLIFYFEHCFLPEACTNIRKKALKMCDQWTKVIRDCGWKALLRKVEFRFENNPRAKLLWSLAEVQTARDEVVEFLSRQM